MADSDKWDFISFLISGLILFLYFGTMGTVTKARKVFDNRVEINIAKFKPGMAQKNVEELILETNLNLIGPNENKNKDYILINDFLTKMKQGKKVDFENFMAENNFSPGLFKQDEFNLKDPKKYFFKRSYSNDMDYQISYQLRIEYDVPSGNQDNKLKSAVYSKSVFMEEPKSCDIIIEIPAEKSKTYPYPCPEEKKE